MSEVCTRLSAILVVFRFYLTSVFSRDNCGLVRASSRRRRKRRRTFAHCCCEISFYRLYKLIFGLIDEQAMSKHGINGKKRCMLH